MPRKTQYYKVVSVAKDGNFYSAVANYPERVKYRLNAWTVPNRGENPFLFVFSKRASARIFKKGTHHKVFKCEVQNPSKEIKALFGVTARAANYFDNTVFVTAVKLIGPA